MLTNRKPLTDETKTVQDMEREVQIREGAFMDQNWRNKKSRTSIIPTAERARIRQAKVRMVDFLTQEEQAELAMIYIYGFEGKLNVQSPEATTVYQAAKQKLQKLLSTGQT